MTTFLGSVVFLLLYLHFYCKKDDILSVKSVLRIIPDVSAFDVSGTVGTEGQRVGQESGFLLLH